MCLVLLHHYCKDVPAEGIIDRFLLGVASAGWMGVDVFFALSGYLITGVLLEAKGSAHFFRSFFARRALRIFPAYYLLLTLYFVVAPLANVSLTGHNAGDGLWFWFYASNVLTVVKGWPDVSLAHLWSLAIEEHFYLLWPLLIYCLPLRHLKAATILIALSSALLRSWGLAHGWTTTAAYVLTFARVDALALGATLAVIIRANSGLVPHCLQFPSRALSLVTVLTLAVLIAAGFGGWGTWEGQYLAWGLGFLGLGFTSILASVLSVDESQWSRRLLRSPPLVAVGRLSYGLYLYHLVPIVIAHRLDLQPVAHALPGVANWPYLIVYIVLQSAIVFFIAFLSYRFIEAPLLRLKERFS